MTRHVLQHLARDKERGRSEGEEARLDGGRAQQADEGHGAATEGAPPAHGQGRPRQVVQSGRRWAAVGTRSGGTAKLRKIRLEKRLCAIDWQEEGAAAERAELCRQRQVNDVHVAVRQPAQDLGDARLAFAPRETTSARCVSEPA